MSRLGSAGGTWTWHGTTVPSASSCSWMRPNTCCGVGGLGEQLRISGACSCGGQGSLRCGTPSLSHHGKAMPRRQAGGTVERVKHHGRGCHTEPRVAAGLQVPGWRVRRHGCKRASAGGGGGGGSGPGCQPQGIQSSRTNQPGRHGARRAACARLCKAAQQPATCKPAKLARSMCGIDCSCVLNRKTTRNCGIGHTFGRSSARHGSCTWRPPPTAPLLLTQPRHFPPSRRGSSGVHLRPPRRVRPLEPLAASPER